MGIPCVLRGATPCAWLLLLMVVATKYEPGAREFHQTLLPREPGRPGAPQACLRCDDSVRRGPGPCSRVGVQLRMRVERRVFRVQALACAFADSNLKVEL